jgi:hypothetical protein
MNRALVALAERGVRAEAEAKDQLKSTYIGFLAENDPARKDEAGQRSDPRDLREGCDCRTFNSLTFRAEFGNICPNESMSAACPSQNCRRCRLGQDRPHRFHRGLVQGLRFFHFVRLRSVS